MALTRALMQLQPIMSALRRHKTATVLIVLQVALTLAVASNALFIVATRVIHQARSSGTDEAHVFVMRSGWKRGLAPAELDAGIRADLDLLRRVAGVRDAFSSHAFPMEGSGIISTSIKLKADQTTRPATSFAYPADDHAIGTLGATLAEGRNFRPDEIMALGPDDAMTAPVVIITRSLADKLFPDGSALGKTIYVNDRPAAIVGILASLQSPLTSTRTLDGDSVLVPARYLDPDSVVYLVRANTTTMAPVIAAAQDALQAQGSLRLVDPKHGVLTLLQAREQAYASDRSVASLMSIVCGLLLLATAGGIVGLSSFWVGQRRKQIGIRRSLGASRGDILGYFHAENLLIVGGGVAIGMALAFLANIGLMSIYPLPHMPVYVPALGAVLLLMLGQLAVLGPARHAARVPPVVAIRST